MSTIAEKLNRLLQYKLDIKSAIINKGQTVDDNMSTFADAISKISGGGGELPEILDTDPLTFVRVDNSGVESSISLNNIGTPANKPFEYNKNDTGWKTYTIGTKIPMNYADKLQFRSNTVYGMNNTISESNYRQFKTINGMYNCGGQLISLTNNSAPSSTSITHYASFKKLFAETNILKTPIYNNISPHRSWFNSMFENCRMLRNADNINNVRGIYACSNMFNGCTSLVTAPELPATALQNYCYSNMFKGCTSLVTAPSTLPATTLANNCYEFMFDGCTSLVTAPELPATTLASGCYASMFNGCTSLVTAPSTLPATTLANNCYENMFNGCTSLVTAPELPATTLARYCYYYMFYNCTSLVTAPSTLPATTLADYCCMYMFQGCTSLVTAPELPATTLAYSCYQNMFYNCTSLVTAPKLPATTLASSCYTSMFQGCIKLKEIYCMARYSSGTTEITTIIGNYWLSGPPNTSDCIFHKNPEWAGPTTRGTSTIPSNWQIVDWIQDAA